MLKCDAPLKTDIFDAQPRGNAMMHTPILPSCLSVTPQAGFAYRSLPLTLLLLAIVPCSIIVAGPQEDDSDVVPGLLASIQVDSAGGLLVDRVDHCISYEPALKFHQIRWTGLLQVRGSQRVQFHAIGAGQISIAIDGNEILTGNIPPARRGKQGRLSSQATEIQSGFPEFVVTFTPETDSPFALYWSSDSFSLEPLPSHLLWHESEDEPETDIAQGAALSRGLRCAACHEYGDNRPPLRAPDLTQLASNLRPSWLVGHLTRAARKPEERMPAFDLHRNDAAAISASLFAASRTSPSPPEPAAAIRELNKKLNKKEERLPTQASAQRGKEALASIGCLACHQVGTIAQPKSIAEKMFGGGDLSKTAAKRTREFLMRWLRDPSTVNPSHRMPTVELSPNELWDIAEYLEALGQDESRGDTKAYGDADRGPGLISTNRCAACHTLPAKIAAELPATKKTRITGKSNFQGGCLTEPNGRDNVPGFSLAKSERASLQQYIATLEKSSGRSQAGHLLAENNCSACHSRNGERGISKHIASIVKAVPELAAEAAGLSPPSLNSIGDKLHANAIRDAIRQSDASIRPWLKVRMPKFELNATELAAIVNELIVSDRLPEIEPVGGEQLLQMSATAPVGRNDDITSIVYEHAASRLVTADGFGCQSCHAIGNAAAPSVDLKARGPNLSLLGKRIRPDWFYRWVRNPARIVPRMEMPAIQNAARGLLDDSLDKQLAALWRSLNDPGFEAPEPNPTTIVRMQNLGDTSQPIHVLTDVFEYEDTIYLRPIVVGLHNRQNVMIDLEKAELAMWWSGDTAYQRTRGKTWYWEPANRPHSGDQPLERYSIQTADGQLWRPAVKRQVAARLKQLEVDSQQVTWRATVHFTPTIERNGPAQSDPQWLDISVSQTILANDQNGFDVSTTFEQLPKGAEVLLGKPNTALGLRATQAVTSGNKTVIDGSFTFKSRYAGRITDKFPTEAPPAYSRPAVTLGSVPGFSAQQLPLPISEMPISLSWSPSGEMYAGSLKGNILRVVDSDSDGLEDSYEIIAPNFPTPYGLYAGKDYVDVVTKYALVRLSDRNEGRFGTQSVLVDDWGYTHDYHDWAVGLERGEDGSYYIALPCQQDDRSPAAAHRRGTAVKLTPTGDPSRGLPQAYVAEEISAGLRFPMGIALSRSGDLFTSDNQGNYNPFNEINHLRPGKRYGFINKLEQSPDFSPPLESPAINLPHPWTRSVNGICFLDTPATADSGSAFGPFEGHLLGCEMNERSLIRLSLQKVGDTYQGAAYPFSIKTAANSEQSAESPGFEGPIVCEVAPNGDVYIGNLQDSGWGGGQNTGSIVRMSKAGPVPLGIAEVRATSDGFNIAFTQPFPQSALQTDRYSLRSYRRISTPIYGGEDKDSRREKIAAVTRLDDRTVHLRLEDLRVGFVYEIQTSLTGPDGKAVFPAEAHYTLRSIPK